MILRSGVTGFQPAPSTDQKEFKSICYALAGAEKVEFIEPGGAVRNFYECVIKRKNKKVHVLLNSHYPFAAFTASRGTDEFYFPFIDDPELAELFSPYYEIVSREQLNEPAALRRHGHTILLDNENTLHPDELKQLAFWKPETIGDIVFNYWD